MAEEKDDFASPFSFRMTKAERLKLDTDAGPLPVGEYIRGQLFDNPSARKRTFRRPVQDEQALSQVLAALGRSRLSSNLNQLAKALNNGARPDTPEVYQAILQSKNDIRAMSDLLVKALGLPEGKP